MLPTGFLVWAKQQGSPHWPAIISPNSSGKTKKMTRKMPMFHVLFLNCNNQHAWVSQKNMTEFSGLEDYKTTGGAVKAAEIALWLQSIAIEERVHALNVAEEEVAGTQEESPDLLAQINKSRSSIKLMRTRVNGPWITVPTPKRSLSSPLDDRDSGEEKSKEEKSQEVSGDNSREQDKPNEDSNLGQTDKTSIPNETKTVEVARGQQAQSKESIKISINMTIEMPPDVGYKMMKGSAKMFKNATKMFGAMQVDQ